MFWVLVKKEIRLQRSNILFALAVFLVWCFDFLFLLTGDRNLGSRILTTGILVQIIHFFLVLPCLIVILPMMIGSTSVAQERKIGTFDFQAILPVSRRMKWIAKTGAAIFLAFFLGGIIADILDSILVIRLRGANIPTVFGSQNELPIPLRFRGLHIGIFSVLFCSSGIYMSSLSREPFRALLLGMIPILFIGIIQRVIDPSMMLLPHWDPDIFPSHYLFPFIHYLEFLLISIFLLFLGFHNFSPFHFKWKRVGLHFFLLAVFVNLIGYLALRCEFDIPPIEERDKTYTPGLSKLMDTQIPFKVTRNRFYYIKYGYVFESPLFYRIPESSSILTSKWGKKDIKREDYSELGYNRKIMNINIVTGKVHQYAGIYGEVEEIHPTGSFFIIHPDWNRNPLILFDNGLRFPYIPHFTKYILNGLFNLKMDDPDSISYGRVKIGDGLYELKIPDKEGKITSIFFSNPLSFYYYFLSSDHDRVFFYNLDNPLTKPISPDGKWYAETFMGISPDEMKDFPDFPKMYPALFHPIRIISSDHTTTHVLETIGTITLLRNPLSNHTIYNLYDLKRLFRQQLSLCISSDGRYLAFQRMFSGKSQHQGKTFPDFFPREIQICVLDLFTGEETKLKNISWDPDLFEEDHKFQSYFIEKTLKDIQLWETPERRSIRSDIMIKDLHRNLKLLPLFWLKENILAVQDGGRIYLFFVSPDEKYLLETIDLEKDILLYEKDPYFMNMDAWSNDILLLWGESNLWKLDLREYFKQKGLKNNPWFKGNVEKN